MEIKNIDNNNSMRRDDTKTLQLYLKSTAWKQTDTDDYDDDWMTSATDRVFIFIFSILFERARDCVSIEFIIFNTHVRYPDLGHTRFRTNVNLF